MNTLSNNKYSILNTRNPILHSPFLSTQYSVLSTQFSVLSSQFSVLSSQLSVLSTQFSVLRNVFCVFLFLLFANANASHYMGGEITWTCDNTNGKFHFIMKLYRECGANAVYYNQMEILEIINYPSLGKVTKIKMNRKYVTDNSPVCNPNPQLPHITCAGASQPNMGAVSEYIFTSDTLGNTSGVALNGVPPAQGWIFAYKSPGVNKRNQSDNIVGATNLTWALRAVMYSYKGKNANPCYDNSPAFAEKPNTVICTGYPFTYNPNAYDNELDSLKYDWAHPLDSSMNVINSYVNTFDYQNPLPGPVLNASNAGAIIDPNTGEISFTSFTQGSYLTVSRVRAYKNKILVAEIFREMQIVLVTCPANNPPNITPPFKANTSFIDTVYAGQTVDFPITTTDDIGQLLTLNATGPDFGQNYMSTTTGCMTPPCATLIPPPTLSGSSPINTSFHWQTTCDHLTHPFSLSSTNHLIYNKPTLSNVHNFVISVQDDFCAVPGKNVKTISIVVMNKPILPAPSLKCASVNINGDVHLTWVPPVDTANSFYRYYIYYSYNPKGPFVLKDSIMNSVITSYIHTGANAQNQVVYYYMQSLSACNNSYYSSPGDTISTMLLNVTNPNNGTAGLTWNALHNPHITSNDSVYKIYREYPSGIWKLIGTTKNIDQNIFNYIDTINVCHSQINFQIQMTDNSGCVSKSNIAGDLFEDTNPPQATVIDSVSVDNNQKLTVMGWQKNPSSDAIGYIIYQTTANGTSPIDTIKDINTTFFVFPKSNPYGGVETYSINAYDSCKNIKTFATYCNTLFLGADLDICNSEITLSWNPYKNMKKFEGYRVYYNENNGNYSLLTTITVAPGSQVPTKYLHTGLKPGVNYCYYVKAFDSTGLITSTSNIHCIFSIISQKPKYAYLRYATVIGDKSGLEDIKLRFIADSLSYVSQYIILRADSVNGIYKPVATIPAPGIFDVTYIDKTVFPNKQSYSYKVEVFDSCGNVADTSNVAKTIFLQGTAKSNLSNVLKWNPYVLWDGPVTGYNLIRDIGGVNNYVLLNNLPPVSPYSFTDDISLMTLGEGFFSYYIEAAEGNGATYPFPDVSRSNRCDVLQQPKYFIPNAFNPIGETPEYVPIGIFNNHEGYYFGIFSRWGIKVFETNSPNIGWDGTVNGVPAPLGTYIYILKYKDSGGTPYDRKGSVTLLR